MLDPTSVVVWARSAGCGQPDTWARDQYMPDEGAGGTSGAVLGSMSGGKGMWTPLTWAVRAALACRDATAVDDTAADEPPGFATMADVDRSAVGRRPDPLPLPSAAEESCLSLVCVSDADSPFVERADCGPGDGPGVLLLNGGAGMCGREVEGEAADCDRWRMDSSDGLRRRSWLLVERWPGVWLRGRVAALSLASFSSSSVAGGFCSTGDTGRILWARMILVLTGERGLSPDLLDWSAIVPWHAHEGHIKAEMRGGRRFRGAEVVAGREDGNGLFMFWRRKDVDGVFSCLSHLSDAVIGG